MIFAYFCSMPARASEELEAINIKIAGRLDKNPAIQGLLIQSLNKLEREERGSMSNRGRRLKTCSDKEIELINHAALSLSIAGANVHLCRELGQRTSKFKVAMDDLESYGLPNPCLSLMCPEQLDRNLELIDQRYPRKPSSTARRCILAMDCTYLLKIIGQGKWKSQAGLVGGCWRPTDSSEGFMSIGTPTRGVERASVMLELLLWDPNARGKNETYSLGAMPMSLAAHAVDRERETLTHAGNLEMLKMLDQVLYASSWLVKGVVLDGHHSHRYIKEFDPAMLNEFKFFSQVKYKDPPHHCLPRLPLKLCYHAKESIWMLGGPCTLFEEPNGTGEHMGTIANNWIHMVTIGNNW